jgi:hypothetical protein
VTVFSPYDHLKVQHNYAGTNWQTFTGDLTAVKLVLREFTGKHSGQMSFYNDTMNPALSSGTRVVKKGDRVRIFMDNPSGTSQKVATMKVSKVTTSDQDFTQVTGRQSMVTIDLIGTGITGVQGVA